MGCASSSDNSEFGRRRAEIEKEIDRIQSVGGKFKSAMKSGDPIKMMNAAQSLQSLQESFTTIPNKLKNLREHLDTLKNEPDYAKKENQFLQTEKRLENVSAGLMGNMMGGLGDALNQMK